MLLIHFNSSIADSGDYLIAFNFALKVQHLSELHHGQNISAFITL